MNDHFQSGSPPESDSGLFGMAWDRQDAEVVIIGVPWEPTASYGRGCSHTPAAIVPASHQLDLFDLALGADVGEEVTMLSPREDWLALNRTCSSLADPIIAAGGAFSEEHRNHQAQINQAGDQLNDQLQELVASLLAQGKTVGVIGGDHSSPLGAMKACLSDYPDTGVLHIDAHHDLRDAYLGFTWSHASIMHNLLQQAPSLASLVSVGIRDFSSGEFETARDHPKVTTFYGSRLQKQAFTGVTWDSLCRRMVEPLPGRVYVSFDVDGLEPGFCPNTGTPVPGGLSYAQAVHLLETITASGRRIVGFDLCEVAPNQLNPKDEWDLNVGARLLHKLCCLSLS